MLDRELLERIANTLDSIDGRIELLSAGLKEQANACVSDLRIIAGAVDQMRDDVSGFEQSGAFVPGQLSRILDAIGELRRL